MENPELEMAERDLEAYLRSEKKKFKQYCKGLRAEISFSNAIVHTACFMLFLNMVVSIIAFPVSLLTMIIHPSDIVLCICLISIPSAIISYAMALTMDRTLEMYHDHKQDGDNEL